MKKQTLAGVLAVIGACSLIAGLGACATDEDAGHNYSDDWKADDKFHWHECTDENCDRKGSLEAHKWNGGTETAPATCTDAGEKSYECTVCHETKTEEIAKLIHNWQLQEDKGEASSCTKKGFAVYKCSHCKTEENRELDFAKHVTEEKSDAYSHWSECKNCEYETAKYAHTYTLTDGTATCADCTHEETNVIRAGTLAEPTLISSLPASYAVMLEKSVGFDTENGYYATYFKFTPAEDMRLVLTNEEGANGSFSLGYFKTETGVGGEFQQYYAVSTGVERVDGALINYAEVEAGTEYSIVVKNGKFSGEFLKFGFSEHKHTPDLTKWGKDETHHWRVASCHNVVRLNKAEHSYDSNGACECGKVKITESARLEYTYDSATKTASVSSWNPPSSSRPASVVIPEKKINPADGEEYTVTKITGTIYFVQNDNMLESITLPSTITEIVKDAFKGCEKLKTLYLYGDDDEEVIDAWSKVKFNSATSNPLAAAKGGNIYVNGTLLENIDIAVSGNVADYAFTYCTSLKTVKLNVASGVTEGVSVGNAFQNCANLESIVFGEGITVIGQAGQTCAKLSSVTLPSTLTSFNGCRSCSALKSVVINCTGALELGTYAFRMCSGLNNVYFNGTSAQWDEVKETWLAKLTSAELNVYFYSETSAAGCWRFVDGVATAWE